MDRTRKRKADTDAAPHSASKRQKLPTETPDSVKTLGLKLVDSIKNARDKTGRGISDAFLDLPDRRELPDYYDIIKLPIAVATVEDKLRANAYSSLTEVESDCKRLVANAKTYNEDGSDIFSDAERIRKLLHNWMKVHNPAYKDPNYVAFATPIPDEKEKNRPTRTNGAVNGNVKQASPEPTPRSKRPTITLSKTRRQSTAQPEPAPQPATPAATASAPNGNEWEGKSFGQVQEQILEDLIQYRDGEGDNELQIYQPFQNLPSRSLADYYQVIKRPVSLKSIVKRAKGQHGREAGTGITDFKTWDAFEEEVSMIWRNAQEYNEDGSEMYELAEEFKKHFLAKLAEVKVKVDEPAGTRIKLNARPKPVLHLGATKSAPVVNGASSSPGPNADEETTNTAPQVTKAPTPQPPSAKTTPAPPNAVTRSISRDDIREQSIPPVIKAEAAPASSTLDVPRATSTTQPDTRLAPTASMLPPPARQPSTSPAPTSTAPAAPPAPYIPTLAPAPATFAETYHRRAPVTDALLPRLTLTSHPQLHVSEPYELHLDASPAYTQQSLTILLPPTQYYLQAAPSISTALSSGRQYKLFVHVNGVRVTASTRPATAPMVNGSAASAGGAALAAYGQSTAAAAHERRQVYDVPLNPGSNKVDVEIAAVPTRGGSLEVEKMTVNVHLMRY